MRAFSLPSTVKISACKTSFLLSKTAAFCRHKIIAASACAPESKRRATTFAFYGALRPRRAPLSSRKMSSKPRQFGSVPNTRKTRRRARLSATAATRIVARARRARATQIECANWPVEYSIAARAKFWCVRPELSATNCRWKTSNAPLKSWIRVLDICPISHPSKWRAP